MDSFVIDTNVISRYFDGDKSVKDSVEQYSEVVIPAMVIAELEGGYRNGNRYAKNSVVLNNFLSKSWVRIVVLDRNIAAIYGELYVYLRKNGTPIPTNDIWIAAVAIAEGLPLLTLDSDFDNLPQVRRV
jgi:predicted nucleic acid-binding protein